MAEDSYIDVARQRRTVNKLKELIDKKADADSVASDVFLIKFNSLKNTADKTYQEILDAYNAGKYPLIMTDRNETFLLSYADSSQFRFTDYESWQSSPQNGSAVENVIQYDGSHAVLKVSNLNKWSDFISSIKCWSGTADVFGAEQNYITLKDSAITTAKLADGSVTKAKLGSDVVIPENAAEVFMITVSDMTAEGTWNHDKTWSEINEAYLAGKILQVKYTEAEEQYLNWCSYSNNCFYFANYDPQEDSNILIEIDPDDTAHVTRPSSLPVATASTLGGVKVGDGLSVTDDGVLSAEDDIVFTWDSDTKAFSCNKTFAEVKKMTTTGVRRTATANGYLENFSITLLVVAAGDNGVAFFGTVSTDTLEPGWLGSRPEGTTTYLFQRGLIISYWPNGQIKMTEDPTELINNPSFEFKNTTFQYTRNSSFDLKDGGITSAKLASNAVTADKIADGAITADKLASGVGGGKLYSSLGRFYSGNVRWTSQPIIGNYAFYLDTSFPTDANGCVCYSTVEYGNYIGIVLEHIFVIVTSGTPSTIPVRFVDTQGTTDYTDWKDIGLPVPGLLSTSSNVFITECTLDVVSSQAGAQTNTQIVYWVPKSTSAQAALATLLPVQDECEQMEAEVTKLEQDWIDNPDETVAVDGNGVPITIATKKAELEKKQAELEKLREDYFSKLGDWRNEVQE